MKASEAKTKVCPFIQDAYFMHGHTSGASNIPANINCICGDCMAWVYTKTQSDYPNTRIAEKNQSTMLTEVKMVCGELDDSEKEGYCKRLGQ